MAIFVSSPEQKAQGELFWLVFVRRSSVHQLSFSLNNISSWTTCPNLKWLHMKVYNNGLYQNCINSSAATNARAARVPDKKYFKWHLLNHWSKSKLFHRIVPLAWYALPKLHKGFLSEIRSNLKWHIFLNQRSNFKIILQNCSSWCLLPKLHKWFNSAKQKGRQSSK